MKRIIPAVALLVISIALTIYGSIYIDSKTDDLIGLLHNAHQACSDGDYAGAIKTLDRFDEAFAQDHLTLTLFVRHDLIAELERIVKPLRDYANEDTAADFCIEIGRAVAQIGIIREYQFRLI